jgi:hypothetical protein
MPTKRIQLGKISDSTEELALQSHSCAVIVATKDQFITNMRTTTPESQTKKYRTNQQYITKTNELVQNAGRSHQ